MDPGLARFGIDDWRQVSSYDPRLYSENPESLYSDPLLNTTSPNAPIQAPDTTGGPRSSLGVSLTPSRTDTLFGHDRPLPPVPKDPRETMITRRSPDAAGAAPPSPEDEIHAAYRTLTQDPGALTPQQGWLIRQNDMAQNARAAAENPLAGAAVGGTSQHGTSSTSTTGTASSTSETQGQSTGQTQTAGQTVQQTQLSPDARESLNMESELARQKGVVAQGLGEAQAAYHQAEAGKVADWADQQRKMAIEAQRAAEAQQKRLEAIDREMRLAQNDYQKAAENIDPSRLISGPKSWLAALAMGLGAFGATMGRTQNFAQQIIDQAISRDLEAQKMAVSAKRDQMSFVQQIYQNERARFASQQAAREATRAAAYGIFSTQAAARAETLKGTEAEAGAKQAALQWASEQQKAQTQALMTENKTVSQSTSLAQTQNQEQSSTTGFQSSRSNSNTTSDATSSTYQTQVPAAGQVDNLGAGKKIAEDVGSMKKTFPSGGAPIKADETAYGKAQTKLADLLDLQSSARELMRLNEATNFLDRGLRFSDLSEQQRAALMEFLATDQRVKTGAAASKEEQERQTQEFLDRKYTSSGLNAAVEQAMRNGRFKMGAQIAPLHSQYQDELLNRLKSAGFSPQDLQEIRTRQAAPPADVLGQRFGLTPR